MYSRKLAGYHQQEKPGEPHAGFYNKFCSLIYMEKNCSNNSNGFYKKASWPLEADS